MIKRILVLAVLGLSLAGCNTSQSIFAGGTSLTATVQTPVGRKDLATIWNSYGLILTGARAYKRLCAEKSIPDSCRAVIVQLQGYDRQAYAALVTASSFVKNNPTVSAVSAVAAARQAVSDFQSAALTNGVVK